MASAFAEAAKGLAKGLSAVTDIFREVEEDVRRERLEKLWKAYGDYVIAAAGADVRRHRRLELWQRHEAARARQGSPPPSSPPSASPMPPRPRPRLRRSRQDRAQAAMATVARLAEANAMAPPASAADAVALYKEIADDDSGPIGAVARLRAAWVLADTAPRADLADLLEPLDRQAAPGARWRAKCWPMRLSRRRRQGRRWRNIAALAADPQAPDALREPRPRLGRLPGNGGGAANYGTVPPPAAAPAPGTPPGRACARRHAMSAIRRSLRRRLLLLLARLLVLARLRRHHRHDRRLVRLQRQEIQPARRAHLGDVGGRNRRSPMPPWPTRRSCCRAPYRNPEWPQPGGYPSNAMYHLDAPGPLRKIWDAGCRQGLRHRLAPDRAAGGRRRAASSRWMPKPMSVPSTPATAIRCGTSAWRPRTAPTCRPCGACWASPTPSSRPAAWAAASPMTTARSSSPPASAWSMPWTPRTGQRDLAPGSRHADRQRAGGQWRARLRLHP